VVEISGPTEKELNYRFEEPPGIPNYVYVYVPADVLSKDELTSIAAICNAILIETRGNDTRVLLRKNKVNLFVRLLKYAVSGKP